MARKKGPTLTEAELRLMDILWKQGESTVGEVMEALPEESHLAYNTILTTMRILEQKGYLGRSKSGRAHVYRPLITREQARSKAVRHVVQSFFNDSPELLLLNILKHENIGQEELKRLRDMVNEKGEV